MDSRNDQDRGPSRRGRRRDGRPRQPGGEDRGRRGRGGRPEGGRQERLSRLLAFVLRHHPEDLGIELDEAGTAALDDLVAAFRQRSGLQDLTREDLERLLDNQPAPRYERRGHRVRARYGHTFAPPVAYDPADPPPVLFHGTTPEAAERIFVEGLHPRERQYVHLSVDMPAAREVGRRRADPPVILQVDARGAAAAGHVFHRASPSVWLVRELPPEFVQRVE